MSPYWLILLFLSSLSCHHVLSHSKVELLPGFDGPLPFTLRTGYIGVDEGEEVQLFYYFIESENDPKEDPLLLWLTGGPSCSTISAIVYEIGPLKFEEIQYNGSLPKLVSRQYAWTKMANILFVDLPVGTGFSYAKTPRANYSGDFRTSSHVNQFLRKWLVNYPEFISQSLYIGGDSYSGFTLPLFFEDMLHGNPSTDRYIDNNHIIPFAHGMGLISDELFEELERTCGGEYHNVDPNKVECVNNMKAFEAKEGYELVYYWMADRNVQEALHVRKESIGEWRRCNYEFEYSFEVESSVKYHAKLSTKGFRSLIYSGDHDLVVPFLGTQAWIRSLNYSIVDDWRRWWVDGQIAGFTRTYSNRMTFATIKGAGHTAPEYKPKECLAMFERWIHGNPL
ncbi:hypothetical protein Cgig2_008210 [Carnegiea gigantea]|uniref:Uncharacterized protein n=1 Tax=Carnegiea gigantea TaxID=171969 RepID=A0A9Q1KYU9_9CARY|nr:hypothetical protein Cgig2_008210 [Carnegiea gigantea]